jgi:hypothetical protein
MVDDCFAEEDGPMKQDQPNASAPFPREPVPADLLEWARQTFEEEDFLAQLRDIEATGGLPLEAFIAEVERRARGQ